MVIRGDLNEAARMRTLAAVAIALLLSTGCAKIAERLDWIGSEGNADWIRLDRDARLGLFREPRMIHFMRHFRVEKDTEAQLHLRAMRQVSVYLDNQRVFRTDRNQVGWIAEQVIDLSPFLTAGDHTLLVRVFNSDGANLLLAHSPTLDIATGTSWLASANGKRWNPAALASDPMVAPISHQFERADRATLKALLFLLPAICIGWLALRLSRLPPFLPVRSWFGVDPARRVHVMLMISVGALMLNNVFRLPRTLGFDIVGHYDYILFIIENATIPLATDGWQMFQSPLYYLVAAGVYELLGTFFESRMVETLMRIVSIVCGLWLINLCYRTLRCTFPMRPQLQIAGSAFAALLPVNLCITHYVGNEPMAACFTAASLLTVFRALSSPRTVREPGFQLFLGGMLGLALLAKVTAVLALAPIAIAVAWALYRSGANFAGGAAAAGRIALAMLAVCGWYYGRNWLLLGSPFVGGWSDGRGIRWWQDPGYRHIGEYVRFGQVLSYPIYACLSGFWNGLYSTFWLDGYIGSMSAYDARPPWNYTFMLSLAWLSLPLSGIMLLSVRALRSPIVWFSWCCVGIYLLAVLSLHLMVPHYSQTKASYMLGLAPCFCVLLATGLEQFSARWKRYLMCWLAMWALASYAAFFVIA
jgi:hypothetical protein